MTITLSDQKDLTLALIHRGLSSMDVFKQLDPIGTLLFVPAIICLLLALSETGAGLERWYTAYCAGWTS